MAALAWIRLSLLGVVRGTWSGLKLRCHRERKRSEANRREESRRGKHECLPARHRRADAIHPDAPRRCAILDFMELPEVFQGLGEARFEELVRGISIGRLRTYSIYDSFKIRTRLNKVNREGLRKAVPKFWARLGEGDNDLARELAQGVLVSNLNFVIEVLDFLEVPHDGSGFFQKEDALRDHLTEDWQARVLKEFSGKYPESLILLYTNHLSWEMDRSSALFLG